MRVNRKDNEFIVVTQNNDLLYRNFKENPIRNERMYSRYDNLDVIFGSGYIDSGKVYVNERTWYGHHRTKPSRKNMLIFSGERHWYPCRNRKGYWRYNIGENR